MMDMTRIFVFGDLDQTMKKAFAVALEISSLGGSKPAG